jgi:hypothetical protein
MPAEHDFGATFAACRDILRELEPKLLLNADEPGNYSLDAGYSEQLKKMIWFGGVRIGKNYVSYHLMPVYGCPDLVRTMPDELRRRMQGKSCFNFTSITPGQAAMLRELTLEAYERFNRAGYVTAAATGAAATAPRITSPAPGPSARSGGGCTRPTSTSPRAARPASASRPRRR